jgi:type II secretory pathway component PulK
VLLVILVCFALAAAIFVYLGRLSLTQRSTSQSQHESLQAQWLAEAGVERAAARLADDPGYAGETWTVSAQELAGRRGGVVRIHVAAASKDAKSRLVRVEADYPDDPVHCRRWKKEITVDLK